MPLARSKAIRPAALPTNTSDWLALRVGPLVNVAVELEPVGRWKKKEEDELLVCVGGAYA